MCLFMWFRVGNIGTNKKDNITSGENLKGRSI